MTLVNQTEFARQMGVHRSRVGQLIKLGRVLLNPEGLIDLELNKSKLDSENNPAFKRKSAASTTPVTPGAKFSKARAERERLRTELTRLELAVKKGELVRSDEVENFLFTKSRSARDALLVLPPRLAPILAAESDSFKIEQILQTEIIQCLTELSSYEKVSEVIP